MLNNRPGRIFLRYADKSVFSNISGTFDAVAVLTEKNNIISYAPMMTANVLDADVRTITLKSLKLAEDEKNYAYALSINF